MEKSVSVPGEAQHAFDQQHHIHDIHLQTSLIDLAYDAIIVRDPQSRVIAWNRGAEQLYGYSAQEAIGQISDELLQTRFPGSREALDRFLASGELWQGELFHTRKDGTQVLVESRQMTSRNAQGDLLVILEINRDVTGRKQREIDQLRLAAIVESSDDAIVSKTLEGIITSWNLAAERMFGYSSQEAVGQSITLIIPPELRADEDMILAKLRKGEHIDHFETVRMCKDGSRLDISLTISPIKNSAGQVIGASKIARDITESKRLQRDLKFLADASKILSSSFDYRTTLSAIAELAVPHVADWCVTNMFNKDGSIEWLAVAHQDPQKVEQARELQKKYFMNMDASHGISQILRTGVSKLVPFVSDDLLVAAAVDDDHLKALRALGFTSSMTVPLLVDGKVEGALTFILAESSRHYTQADLLMAEELASRASLAIQNARLYQAVQQSRDQLDIILQGVGDGIIVYAPDSRILYANNAMQMSDYGLIQQMLTAGQSSLLGGYELIDEQEQPFLHTRLPHLRVFAGESEARTVIGSRVVGSGRTERWSLVTSRPVLSENGKVAMVVTIVHDITERMLAERRKDAFISMASHELNTPVTSLKGFTNVLHRRLTRQGDTQGLYYLARIDAQLDRLTILISELLDISRMKAGKLALQEKPVALDALIEDTVEAVQVMTSTHHLHIEGSTDKQVMGDEERLRQVFINLLTNAIKYSHDADRVVVRLARDDEGGQVIVSVQDFGIGIDKRHHEQIFERFYQVSDTEEKTYPGLGIGLYISREIVERHQGRLWVESSKGNGATFLVALPALSSHDQVDLG